MTLVLQILVGGVDITSHVLVESLNFESQMAAVPGTFEFKVKDTARVEDFTTGAEVIISADGVKLFGGYLLQVVREFAFPVVDTSVLANVTARQFTLRGVDYNTLFDKRVLRNVDDFTHFLPAYGPAGVTDGQYISNKLFDWLDTPAGLTFGQIDDVRTYDSSNSNPNGYTPMTQGSLWRQEMENLAQWGALFYIDADFKLQYLAVESLVAPWGFSDKPDKAGIPIGYATQPTYGMREFETTEDGSFIVNDAFVWGGSEWSKGLVFRRKQDATSQSDHNRWQVGELHFGEKGYGIQEGVDQRANVIITGKLDGGTYGAANRGFALPQFQVRCTWFDKDIPTDPNTGLKAYLLPGQLVTFKLFVFGSGPSTPYTLVLPARSIRTSAPTLAPDGNTYLRFEGFFGVQSSDPWWLWKYLRSHTSNSTSQQTTVPVETSNDYSDSTDYGSYGTFTPVETPDGVLTDFNLPNDYGYISGTTAVYINGLAERSSIDYTESDSASGTITFTTAPGVGDSIIIICRTTASQPPVGSPSSGPGGGPSVSSPRVYGSGINADANANLRVGPDGAVAHRFRSTTTSTIDKVRFQQYGSATASGGTGGTMDVKVCSDDGNGRPGSVLATQSYTPGNPGGTWTHYDEVTFSSPASTAQGLLYHITFTNTDGAPSTNFVSVNELFMYSTSPIPSGNSFQPLFADVDYAVLAGGPTWTTKTRHTADMDITYANGTHDGLGYVSNLIASYGSITGTTTMVRERFTVAGGDRGVGGVQVRVRRDHGTDQLVITLKQGASTLATVNVPASAVAISAAGSDDGGSVWAGGTFTPLTLTSGTTYDLILSCAGTSQYTAAPLHAGSDVSMSSYVFSDGTAQQTTNSGGTWTDLNAAPVNLQMYFTQATPAGTGIAVPSSIDATGATNVQSALQNFLNSVPSGSTVLFPPGGIYRVDTALKLQGRNYFTIDGQGASIRANGSGYTEDYSCLYFVTFGGGNNHVIIHDLDLRGSSPTPGVFISGHEGQHGILFDGTQNYEVYNCTGRAFFGDFVEVNSAAANGRIHNNTVTNTGRNGVSVIYGNHVEIDHNSFVTNGYMPFDIEPNNNTQACYNIDFHDNTWGTWSNAFFAIDGSGTGAAFHDISIRNNSSASSSILSVVTGPGRKQRITFTGNSGTGSAGLSFAHVDVLNVIHNTGVSSVTATDCTSATTSPNP